MTDTVEPVPDKRTDAYRAYKNAKKWLRGQVASGKITERERAVKQAEAYKLYRRRVKVGYTADPIKVGFRREDGRLGREFLSRHKAGVAVVSSIVEGKCNEYCLGARGVQCHCPCNGQNHGLARGMNPMNVSLINGEGFTKEVRVCMGLIPLDKYVEWKGHGWNIELHGIPKGWTEQEIRDAGLAMKHESVGKRNRSLRRGASRRRDWN